MHIRHKRCTLQMVFSRLLIISISSMIYLLKMKFATISLLIAHLAMLVNGQNITHDASLFEGDIVPDYATISSVYSQSTIDKLVEEGLVEAPNAYTRGTSPTFTLWKQKMNKADVFVIEAYINPSGYSANQQKTIKTALKKLSKTGVMKFRFPKSQPVDGRAYLHYGIHDNRGCASYIGRQSWATLKNGQSIWLSPGCLSTGTIQHETLHALGFWHEHSRPDRDDYVTIDLSSVSTDRYINFEKQTDKIDSLGAPYDYDSVMHYPPTAFSSNGSVTIQAPAQRSIGQREGISAGDKLQLRLMYQCTTGPRSLTAFKENKCTDTCKCGKNWKGCGSNSEVCKGSFQCQNDKCVRVKE